MAVSMIGPKFYAWDRNGKPLAFGKLYTYHAGAASIPKDTYTSENGSVANGNPVILNGEGYANVYLSGSYSMVLKDSDDNEIWSEDPVSSSASDEWINCQEVIYVSPTSFKIVGNLTGEYAENLTVRIDNNLADFSYSFIKSSSFSGGETTIVIEDAVVLVGVVGACVSIVTPNSLNSQKNRYTINFDSMVEAKESIDKKRVYKGAVLRIGDRGNALFDVVTGEVANGTTIINHDVFSLQIKVRLFEGITTTAIGADISVSNGTGALNAILGEIKRVTVDNEITVNELNIDDNTLILLNGGGQINADTIEGDGVGNGAVDYFLTKRIAYSTNADCIFEIRDRLPVNCKGARSDGNTLGRDFGGNSQAPIFAERAFQFESCKRIVFDGEMFNYLAAGDSLTGNAKDLTDPSLVGNFADVAFVAQNCMSVEVLGKWRNNGSEMSMIRDTNVDGSKVSNLLFKSRCDDNHRSHLWYKLKGVIVQPSFLTKHEASPINAFSDNQVINSPIIDDVNASHGIDLSEGFKLTRNVQIFSPVITNVNNSCIYAATVALKVVGGFLSNADYGIRNRLGATDTVIDVPGDTTIDNTTIHNCNVGAIQVTGKRAVPEYTKTTITNCKLWQNLLVADSFAIDIQSGEDIDIIGNTIEGFDRPITCRTRINRLQIERNTFDQIYGKELQGYDDINLDLGSDTVSPTQITIARNQFKQPPSIGKWSFAIVNFDGNILDDINLLDNEGHFYYRVVDTDINYRREYTRRWQGAVGDGTFEGGSLVKGQSRANTDYPFWKFIQYDGNHNLGVTMGTDPTATAATVNGTNVVTMSTSSHGIEVGEFIDIGGVIDALVLRVDGDKLYLWKSMAATSGAVAVAYNGNVRTGYLGRSAALTAVI